MGGGYIGMPCRWPDMGCSRLPSTGRAASGVAGTSAQHNGAPGVPRGTRAQSSLEFLNSIPSLVRILIPRNLQTYSLRIPMLRIIVVLSLGRRTR